VSGKTQCVLAIGGDKKSKLFRVTFSFKWMKRFFLIDMTGTDITWAKLDELQYLNNVIKESMRLHPAVTQVGRESAQYDTLGGYHIPANTHFLIGIHVIHRSEKYWQDPETFKPERFENLSK